MTEIIAAFSVLAGYLLKMASDWFGATNEEQRQRKQRRDEFQNKTLLELQETTYTVMRGHVRVVHHHEMAFRSSGYWGTGRQSDEESQEMFGAQVRLGILRVRVEDDQVRAMSTSLVELLTDAVIARTGEEAHGRIDKARILFGDLNNRIGELLRSTL
jgi:hypothetical protein